MVFAIRGAVYEHILPTLCALDTRPWHTGATIPHLLGLKTYGEGRSGFKRHATYSPMWTSVAGWAAEASGQYRAMLNGINGKSGIRRNATSVTCGPGRAVAGSNPTLTARVSIAAISLAAAPTRRTAAYNQSPSQRSGPASSEKNAAGSA
jgi:hypothetical protein